MSTHAPILVVGDPAGVIARGAHAAELDLVEDVDTCLDRMSWLRNSGRPARMVAISIDVPKPLTSGRRVRSADRHVGLAYIVPDAAVVDMRNRLALSPDLSDVVVIPGDQPDEVVTRLQQAAGAAIRRSRSTQALEAMNRGISRTLRDTPAPSRPGVSERYLAALMHHAPDAIISVDASWCVVASNAAADRILQLDGCDTEGTSLQDLVRAHDREQLDRLVASVMDGASQEGTEVSVDRGNGTSGVLSITAAPVLDRDGSVAGAVFLARDLTERRRTDERLQHLQRAEGLATIAAGVAHDFNNLLVVVQGWVALAAADPGDAAGVSEALGHIRTAAERAAELAQAMLAYGGRAHIDPQPCDVSALVEGIRRLFAVVVPKTVDLEVDLDQGLPDVLVDTSELQQVVMNLVTNATEAIGEEGGTIRIRTARLDPETAQAPNDVADLASQGGVIIEVSDSGPGMDEQTTARCFDLFFSTKFVGRGLGLAASAGIVRAHGGRLSVDTGPGDGTRFRVTLPAVPGTPS